MKEIDKNKAWFLLYRLSLDECVVEFEGDLYRLNGSQGLLKLSLTPYEALVLRLRCLHVIPDPILSIGEVLRVASMLGSLRLTLTNDNKEFLSEAISLSEALKVHKETFAKSVGLNRLRGDWTPTPLRNLREYDIVSYTSVPTTPFVFLRSDRVEDTICSSFMLVDGSIFQMTRMPNSLNELRRYTPFSNEFIMDGTQTV